MRIWCISNGLLQSPVFSGFEDFQSHPRCQVLCQVLGKERVIRASSIVTHYIPEWGRVCRHEQLQKVLPPGRLHPRGGDDRRVNRYVLAGEDVEKLDPHVLPTVTRTMVQPLWKNHLAVPRMVKHRGTVLTQNFRSQMCTRGKLKRHVCTEACM